MRLLKLFKFMSFKKKGKTLKQLAPPKKAVAFVTAKFFSGKSNV